MKSDGNVIPFPKKKIDLSVEGSAEHASAPIAVLPGSPTRLTWLQSVCRSLLISSFSKMTQGRLTLLSVDAPSRTFGNPDFSEGLDAVIRVHNPEFYTRCVLYGHIGFGESYIDGDWDTNSIEAVISWFVLNIDHSPVLEGSGNKGLSINLLGKLNRILYKLRPNSLKTSERNIREHYDLSNDFFTLFLDPTMTYSSARFTETAQTLEAAQVEKYDHLCRQLKLQASDNLLEIGTGWGGFSIHAATTYGCRITSITISKAQYDYAVKRIADAGLSDRVTVLLKDYRELTGVYDKIASIEMIEAVGDAYYETYFATCYRLLKRDGLLGIQMITCPDSRFQILRQNVDFIQKHIFPGSLLPSMARVNQALNKTGDLFLYELTDLGSSYAKTLGIWNDRFTDKLDEVRALGFDERFIRKWHYYLLYCKAAFSMRNITVVQAIYTRPNNLFLAEASRV